MSGSSFWQEEERGGGNDNHTALTRTKEPEIPKVDTLKPVPAVSEEPFQIEGNEVA